MLIFNCVLKKSEYKKKLKNEHITQFKKSEN